MSTLFGERYFSRHLIFISGYQIVHILIHLALISVVSFFHFLLKHRLADIEDWIFDKGWEIATLGKILSFIVIYWFLNSRFETRHTFKKVLTDLRGKISSEVFIAIFFLFIFTLFIGVPYQGEFISFSLFKGILAFICSTLFFMTDALILLLLNAIYPLKKKYWHLEILVFSLMTYLISLILFQYSEAMGFFVFFGHFLTFYLLRFKDKLEWIHALFFNILYLSPLIAVFGLDPIWGGSFSPLNMKNSILPLEFVGLAIVVFFYWSLKKRKSFL